MDLDTELGWFGGAKRSECFAKPHVLVVKCERFSSRATNAVWFSAKSEEGMLVLRFYPHTPEGKRFIENAGTDLNDSILRR